MIAKSNLSTLRRKIAKSIKQPKFLIDPSSTLSTKNLTWNVVHNILYQFLDGVQPVVLSKSRVKFTCNEVAKLSDDLEAVISDKDLVYVWLYMGELVEEWIEWSVELDEFECAENLKKILNNEY